ncbi:MAG: SigB/SigF/SigG family RNA polymerase sigma factor [Clostridia bacterium]
MSRKVYICNINTSNIPRLTNDETITILHQIKDGSEQAKEHFIYCNMRLVLSVAQRFCDAKESMDDIFQVGCVGLMKAIDNFDLTLNVRFSTYAVPMIIGEIKRFLRDSSSMRVSRSLRDTAYMVLKSKERLSKDRADEVSLEEIASDLNLTLFEVVDAIDAISAPLSLDEAMFNDDDDQVMLLEHIADEKQNSDKWLQNVDLKDAVMSLDTREKQILDLRYFAGKTQMEVSNEIGISQAQVSRLEKNALEQIKRYMT